MKKMYLGNAEPPQGNSNAKAQMAVMHDFGFPVYRSVRARNEDLAQKKIHTGLILLAPRLKHEFGIYLPLVASKNLFSVFNGSKVMLRINSFTNPK